MIKLQNQNEIVEIESTNEAVIAKYLAKGYSIVQ